MFKKMTKGTINDNDDSDEYSLLKSESLAMEEMVGKNKTLLKRIIKALTSNTKLIRVISFIHYGDF